MLEVKAASTFELIKRILPNFCCDGFMHGVIIHL